MRIAVLATGGTIAGRAGAAGSAIEYDPGVIRVETLLEAAPGLASLAEIECAQIANLGSEHMSERVWRELAGAVAAALKRRDVGGIVVLHGTDTMEETAFFLDCLFGGAAGVPIVLTGAMLPADAVSADGPGNILNAVRVAAEPDAAGRGVLVAFANAIHEAARVYKADTLAVNAFRSTGRGPAGVVAGGVVRFHDVWGGGEWPELDLPPEALPPLPEVGILYGHAGMDGSSVAAFLGAAEWRGIVHAGVGMGNVHEAALPALREAARRGVPVVRATRVDGGTAVEKGGDRAGGFLCAHSLNPQKARVLLQLALAANIPSSRLQPLFDCHR